MNLEPNVTAIAVQPAVFDPKLLAELPSPCLVVDRAASDRNIERMAARFADTEVKLRPHFKAHKCTTLMKRQLAAGSCVGVTCATAWEAEVLAREGFEDILLANQVADRRGLQSLVSAARRSKLTVCVDDERHVALLEEAAAAAGVRFGVLIEVDVGMVRCGVPAGSADLVTLAQSVHTSPSLEFRGLQGYEGHAVLNASREERTRLTTESAAILVREKARVEEAGLPCPIVSGGGTGTFDIAPAAGALNEIQAGSYALMDKRYGGLDTPFENALFCCTTVISRHGTEAVINSGLKALSAEYGMSRPLPDGLEITVLSDEHAQVTLPAGFPLAVGDTMLVVPAHIDPTINLYSSLVVFDGDGGIEEWPVDGRRP
jgi:D-serine deaminase-like pyridoxal phosphate-dependent protein